MWITDAARAAGVNVQTVRFYERRGLLGRARRSASGYREFGAQAVRLVRFIKRAQALGFSLDEAEALVKLRGARGRGRARVRVIAEEKLADIDRRIADLSRMRAALATLVDSCAHHAELECPILEALDTDADEARA